MSPAPSCRNMEGPLNKGVFTLKDGVVVEVPGWAIPTIRPSRNAEAFSDTPHYIPIERFGSGRYGFINPGTPVDGHRRRLSTDPGVKKSSARPPRKVLFVPAGLKGGDKIRIVWVEKKSACAVLVEKIEELGFAVTQPEGESEAVAFHSPLDGSSEAIQTPA